MSAGRTTIRPAAEPVDLASLERPAAERAALAGMLLAIGPEPERVAEIAAGLWAGMFADPIHAEIMAAIQVALAGERPGIAAIVAAIRRRAADDGLDGEAERQLLADLAGEWLGPDACRAAELAAAEVREAHGRRLAVLALADGLERVRSGKTTTAADLAEITAMINTAQEIMAPPAWGNATGLVAVLEHWAKNESRPAVKTLFSPIDDRLGGLPVGINAIAAPPTHGKSALALQLTLGALLADPEAKAIWFRGEMFNDQLAARIVATWSCLRADAVAGATAKDARRRSTGAQRVADDLVEIIGDRLVVVDPPITPEVVERAIVAHKPRLAVVDYLQKTRVNGKADRRSEVEHMLRVLDHLAITNEVAVIVVSSIAKGTDRDSEIGTLSKESNQLDYDAQTVVTLWGDKDREADPRKMRLAIKKARDGGEGSVDVLFSGSSQFFSVEDPPVDPFPEFRGRSPERLG